MKRHGSLSGITARESVESWLVIALSRPVVSDLAVDDALVRIGEGIDWTQVFQLAARWRVEPMVYENLAAIFGEALPSVEREAIRERLADLRSSSRVRAATFMGVAGALAGEGIPTIFFKGPAVAISAYGSHSRREYVDLDLLLRRTDILRAWDVLVAHGLAPRYDREIEPHLLRAGHSIDLFDDACVVELHWMLLPVQMRFDMPLDEIWQSSLPLSGTSSLTRRLAVEHEFLYLCAHGAKHRWSQLRWVADIAQIASAMTPEQAAAVVRLGAKTNGRRILGLALRMIQQVFPEDVTPFPPSAFAQDEKADRLCEAALNGLFNDNATPTRMARAFSGVHPYAEPLAFWLTARERLIDRIGSISYMLFTPAASEMNRSWGARAIRPLRLAARAVSHLRQGISNP